MQAWLTGRPSSELAWLHNQQELVPWQLLLGKDL